MTRNSGRIYFVKPAARPWVKIGWATNLERRLTELQCGSPEQLTVLCSFPGTLLEESAIRALFGHLEGRGEWKEWHPDISEFIAEVTKDVGYVLLRLEQYQYERSVGSRIQLARNTIAASLACELQEWIVDHPDVLSAAFDIVAKRITSALQSLQDSSIDERDAQAATEAADQLIATVMPLSSVRQEQ